MLTLAFTALFALVALALFPTAAALQEDLAGKVDWHTRLVGVPLLNVNGRPALSPRTVCAKLCAPGAARNLLVSVSEKNVLAAVNAVDGEIGMFRIGRDGSRERERERER
jgi:hypothetical protein